MTKIIHVISDSNIGGAGIYLLNYLENCDVSRFDIKVVVPFNSKLIEKIARLGFTYFEIEGLAEQSYSKTAVKELKKIFKSERPHIVHAHACLSARIAAKLCGVKTVYTRHTDARPSKKLTNPVGKTVNKIINGYLADGIIAVSDSARKNLLATGVSDKKIKVIYNGVPPAKRLSQEECRKVYDKFGIDYGTKVIGIVARLEEIKGHEYFIDAAKIVETKGYDAVFVIAGTGTREEFLKEYVAENEVGNIRFLGFVENVSELNNIMYLQLNTSSYEAFGLAVIEGMRLGVPAIVSSYGGNPEVTRDGINGYVVNGQDAGEFAEKIISLIENSDLYKKLSDGSVEIFNRLFKASIMASDMEKYYLEILEGKK